MKVKLINEIEIDDKLKDYLLVLEEVLLANRGYLFLDCDNGDRHTRQSIWKGMNEYEVLGRLVSEQQYILQIIKGDVNVDKVK